MWFRLGKGWEGGTKYPVRGKPSLRISGVNIPGTPLFYLSQVVKVVPIDTSKSSNYVPTSGLESRSGHRHCSAGLVCGAETLMVSGNVTINVSTPCSRVDLKLYHMEWKLSQLQLHRLSNVSSGSKCCSILRREMHLIN